MVATFNGNPRATIISCYSPTNVSEETGLMAFCNELSFFVRSIPKPVVLVMYAQIGQLNGFKNCYVALTIQFSISHLFPTQLNDQTVLFDR